MTSGADQLVLPLASAPSDGPAPNGPGAAPSSEADAPQCETSRWAVFAECPHCAGEMAPEHAHYRCTSCGWRDSCCD